MAFADNNIVPPPGFRTEEFLVRPITVADSELDYAAVMASKHSLRKWEGSTWPEDDFTAEDNLADMEKMEQRHLAGYAFGFTIMNLEETECLGCVYVMAPDAKMYLETVAEPLGDREWSAVDATIFFWVAEQHVDRRLDRAVLDCLVRWLEQDWSFDNAVLCTNESFEQQMAMFENAGLRPQFRIRGAGEAAGTVAFV